MYKLNILIWKKYNVFNNSKYDLCQTKPNKCI